MGGATVLGTPLDIADADALTAWVTGVAELLGGIDMIVSNVSALAIEDKPENWTASFQVDLMGTVRIVNAAMPYLEASSAPSIVAVSSVSGREIDFAAGPYGTFKAALIHYMQGLAHQLADKGIRANAVSPGNTYFDGGVWANIEQNLPDLLSSGWRRTRPVARARRRRSRARSCSCRARCRAVRAARTSSSTERCRGACSSRAFSRLSSFSRTRFSVVILDLSHDSDDNSKIILCYTY